ncbi:eCIS core domain-containing protein [Microcystis aeruginosa]|uniref:DUF4157 domain-containing protein n=1 Tax=Microcystis aeruginosa FD4 TaxID=2686288 RepID=A0A857D421_MICAE|nr:DUF4157 domain-containing protein [Microcystis aeruginosa]QGZ90598.1 DUF4157 domain-containing protein [Microcystis aeruginosa FD4]
MRDRQSTPDTKSQHSQPTKEREAQRATAQEDVLATQQDPLTQAISRIGSAPSAKVHADLLSRATSDYPARSRQLMLQMQRQYGNRYVQRVMELSRQGEGEAEATPEVEAAIEQARGGGRSLDSGIQRQMESAFGTNFSGVRVHTDSTADALNQSLSARAFTTGQDIFFRQGEYNPGSSGGKELLAHELTHVVQQTGGIQPKLIVGQPRDRYEQEADRVASAIIQHPCSNSIHDLAPTNTLQRKCEACKREEGHQVISIPAEGKEEIIDIGLSPHPMTKVISSTFQGGLQMNGNNDCAQPMSMTKVVSGIFQGGLKMDDYYPYLAGGGFWQHADSGGTWDTGNRVGANAQLFGTIPSPCRPEQFSLAQTVTYTRALFDGVRHPKEGIVQDDIAKSGQDASRPPFRQAWLGGGYNISMADPPSVPYTSTSNIEFDRSFVTSLVGPGGRRSVNWSTSIQVVNGTVTRNTIS